MRRDVIPWIPLQRDELVHGDMSCAVRRWMRQVWLVTLGQWRCCLPTAAFTWGRMLRCTSRLLSRAVLLRRRSTGCGWVLAGVCCCPTASVLWRCLRRVAGACCLHGIHGMLACHLGGFLVKQGAAVPELMRLQHRCRGQSGHRPARASPLRQATHNLSHEAVVGVGALKQQADA